MWICQDCLILLANDEMPTEPTDRVPLSAIDAGDELTPGMDWRKHECGRPSWNEGECECETTDFSWTPCEGCGSPLGGDRYAATLWWD